VGSQLLTSGTSTFCAAFVGLIGPSFGFSEFPTVTFDQ
jgi:hypothetical protein